MRHGTNRRPISVSSTTTTVTSKSQTAGLGEYTMGARLMMIPFLSILSMEIEHGAFRGSWLSLQEGRALLLR